MSESRIDEFDVRCTNCKRNIVLKLTHHGASLMHGSLCGNCNEGHLEVVLRPRVDIQIKISLETLRLLESFMVDGDTYDDAIKRVYALADIPTQDAEIDLAKLRKSIKIGANDAK